MLSMLNRRIFTVAGAMLAALMVAAVPLATPADAGADSCIASAFAVGGNVCEVAWQERCGPTGQINRREIGDNSPGG